MSQHHDLYASVTERIIEDLRQGVRPWAPSWKKGEPARGLPLRHTGVPYRGVNVLILWLKGEAPSRVQAMMEGWLPSRSIMPSKVALARRSVAGVSSTQLGISVQTSRPRRSATS